MILGPCLTPRRNLFRGGLHPSFAQRLVLVNLSPPAMDHRFPDPSNVQSCPQFCCFYWILLFFVRTPPPCTLNTYMLRSTNWKIVIPSTLMRSNYVGVSCSKWRSTYISFRRKWRFKNTGSHTDIRQTWPLLFSNITLRAVCKWNCDKMH